MSLKKEDYERLDNLPDDEAILELDELLGTENDKQIVKEDVSGIVEQEEKIVYYEIENIFKNPESKAYRSRLRMWKNPPVLVIKDSDDNQVQFALTENLTNDLIESLNEVQRAYYGFAEPERKDLPDKFTERIAVYFKEAPVKTSVGIFVLLFTLFLLIWS